MTATCEYHDKPAAAQAALEGALDRDRQPGLFDRASWFEALLRHCLPDACPQFLVVRAGGAALCLPLMRRPLARLDSLANWYSFRWAPVWGGAPDEIGRLALLRAAARSLPTRCSRIVLSPVPDEDRIAAEIADAFAAEGWLVGMEPCDTNHILPVAGRSFDAYWQARPGRLRSTVKRKGRGGAVQLRIATEFDEASWADYRRVYAASWKPQEGSPAFLEGLARSEGRAGTLRLGLAYINGQPAAAQFWTVENGVALIHKLAHGAAHDAASPGTLLSAAMFQHAIDIDRVDLIDFGTGDDGYKADWMEKQRRRYRIDMIRPERPLAWPALARRLCGTIARGLVARIRRA